MTATRTPAIAVCIPTFNQAQYVTLAVASALRQTGCPDVEVWVADDASTDDTPRVMTELCARESRVRYHRHERNLGIAENSSWVLARPTASLVVRLDSDDLLKPDYLAKLSARLLAHPDAGYAHSAVEVIDGSGTVQGVSRLYRPGEYVGADVALREALRGYKTVANILMFRAEALREANYYHGRPDYTEDYDLSVRLADLGYGNVYVDEPLAQYRVWGDAGGHRHHRKATHLRGLTRVFDETFVPAYRRRGWNLAEVRRARRRTAVQFATSIYVPWFSEAERAELGPLLYRLDDSPAVRLRVLLLRMGFAPFFGAVARADSLARRRVKNLLAWLRSAWPPRPPRPPRRLTDRQD